ncbi:IS66 family insertion sequence element accessory protein TnpB [Heliobacterium gestii]|uniref:IS66 family insertion sequence element accessory protein TnpB n=1 Tax=Heliomicrobium gestii TaxID=2699 RepID=A0A845LF54_HELGE|nr:IS66 family insertion sequence element accessory protein TnpB [Heliomicrobium gestii]MBM7866645.1 transposase [Heliomicrobium gestii]MZP43075.1 IS66 family insertion sequence element accessory protein TnpB [Heliomicrobium gestii]
MLKDILDYKGIYLACGSTDLRRSVDGLAIIVKQQFKMDPFGNYLFLFCNGSRNRLKGLSWDRNGFSLYYKRLDGAGARFQWPREPADVRNITVSQLRLLMEGLSIDPPKGFGEVTARDFC